MRKKAHGSPHLPQDNGVWPIWIDQRANKALSQVFDLRNFISLGEQRIRPSRTSPQKKLVGVAPNGRVALAGGSFERATRRFTRAFEDFAGIDAHLTKRFRTSDAHAPRRDRFSPP